jgi:histidyl-tRNA synthetase
MITQDCESVDIVNDLLRKIRIKKSQLQIAQESNLVYTAKALENQILELQSMLSQSRDPELEALMSLLDD